METQLERRIHNASRFGIETRANGKKYLTGYGIVFNVLSRSMYGWYERILPAVLDGCDVSEVICKFNHDMNMPLGTSWARTLTWEVDEIGVKYSVELPDTNLGRDIEVLVNRGDLRDSSFEFTTATGGVDWVTEETTDGFEIEIREVKKLRKLWDLSPVMLGAYPDTGKEGLSVAKREYETFKESRRSAAEQQKEDGVTPPAEERSGEETSDENQQGEVLLSVEDEFLLNGW